MIRAIPFCTVILAAFVASVLSASPVGATAQGGVTLSQPASALTGILNDCGPDRKKACVDAIWGFADVTRDNRLSPAELTRFLRVASEFMVGARAADATVGAGSGSTLPVTDNDRAGAVAMAFLTGPLAAQIVLLNFDYNGDQTIDRAEMFLDLGEVAFYDLVAVEADKLPERTWAMIIRALQTQQQLGLGQPGTDAMPPRTEKLRRSAPARQSSRAPTLSQAELEALTDQLSGCWQLPETLRDQTVVVHVRIVFAEDGAVRRADVVEANRMRTDKRYRLAGDAAQQAALKCGPYRLPRHKYAAWKELTLRFDSRDAPRR